MSAQSTKRDASQILKDCLCVLLLHKLQPGGNNPFYHCNILNYQYFQYGRAYPSFESVTFLGRDAAVDGTFMMTETLYMETAFLSFSGYEIFFGRGGGS